MNKLVEYLFYDDVYGVAIRKLDSNNTTYYTKKPTFKYWYADPFVCNHEGKEYLFVEVMEYINGLGRIGVAPINGNEIGEFKIILKEPFHLSFPHIFQYKGEWYMIPETGSKRQMRLYKATAFPYEWKMDSILNENVNWVDTVFTFVNENEAVGVTYDYDEKKAKPILLDMSLKTMRETKVEGSYSLERPGGTFYQKDGKMYRVVQNCVRVYGDFMHVFEVDEVNKTKLSEKEIYEIHPKDINFDDGKKNESVHTYNKDEYYETVDYRIQRFNLIKMFIWALWKFNRKLGK